MTKRSRQLCRSRTQQLLERLFEGQLAPAELARQMGIGLDDLARWAAEPNNASTLSSLARLADLRAQMLLSSYRANAAIRLIEIASTGETSEIARKACVDLLQANLGVFAEHDDESAAEQQPVVSEEAIRAMFAELGEEQP